jgi:glutamine amidotransferase
MLKIGIIDYGMGNLYSLGRALDRLGHAPRLITEVEALPSLTHLILPGVGSAGPAMAKLREGGWPDAIAQWMLEGRPLLGICLGFQLLFDGSEENGGTEGLGLLPGRVVRFEPVLKVPHMGWNEALPVPESRLFSGLGRRDYYFVHSYFPEGLLDENIAATCDYGGEFVCAVESPEDNLHGVQFHPEKSGWAGAQLLKNFLTAPVRLEREP